MNRRNNFFTCYFCQKRIENETEMGHTSVCGNVLVPCPNKCGSYVPRMEMQQHKKECVNRITRSMATLVETPQAYSNNTASLDRRLVASYKDIIARLQADIQRLSGRVSNYEHTFSQSGKDTVQNHQDLEKMRYQSQVLQEWKKAVDFKLDLLKQAADACEKTRIESESFWTNTQQQLATMKNFQLEVNTYQTSFLKEQDYNRQAFLELAQNLDEFKDFVKQENATASALWNDQNGAIQAVRKDIDDVRRLVEEQKTKTISIVFDIKTISQIASEAAEKLEIEEREFGNLKRKFEQLKLDQEILENLVSADVQAGSPGHLIWKVDNFDMKMSKSRDSNTVIKSPIFYSHSFGYKIRLLAYLNGLKKWKDRYALFSLHVVKGDFDALLKWPCYIEGTITLRDQENVGDPKSFSKHIVAKRQMGDEENDEPQESSFSYIFIPHSTLTNSRYLKNDEVYLEVKIEKSRKLTTETNL